MEHGFNGLDTNLKFEEIRILSVKSVFYHSRQIKVESKHYLV